MTFARLNFLRSGVGSGTEETFVLLLVLHHQRNAQYSPVPAMSYHFVAQTARGVVGGL